MLEQPVDIDAQDSPRSWRPIALRTGTPDWLFSAIIHVLLLALLLSTKAGPGGGGGTKGNGDSGGAFGNDEGRWIEAQLGDAASSAISVAVAATTPKQFPALKPVAEIPELVAPPSPESETPVSERQASEIVQTSYTQSHDAAPPLDATDAAAGEGASEGGTAGPGGVGQGEGDGSPGDGGHGQGGTSLFGIWDAGERFVYVIDRSSSMQHYDKLTAARRELETSLSQLDESIEFQVLFYNQAAQPLRIRGSQGLVRASPVNKNLARREMRLVVAEGGTRHRAALESALRLRPTIVYFLTDAEEPGLTADELAAVVRQLRGSTRIHCIQFGDMPGTTPSQGNWLSQLAAATGGKYLHVRTAPLRAAEGESLRRR